MTIHPKDTKIGTLHGMMLSAIAPRPIAWVSTVDVDGRPNLSPYSFFNAFGSNPTRLIFSPARRVRDNTTKHTLANCIATKECVINVVTYSLVQQASLSSVEYAAGVDEFVKSGLTALESEMVKAPRVKESPVQLECKVVEIIATGTEGGAGNLIICEVLCMHINDAVLDENGKIDAHKIDLVGRMGSDYYVRASGSALFEVAKPNEKISIGFDALPEAVKTSILLTGSDLAMLASVHQIPVLLHPQAQKSIDEQHYNCKLALQHGNIDAAWQVLLSPIIN
jgi:flavin reductase (DIM6/NTAB) family NADH-FMN oxidoreductase RutF